MGLGFGVALAFGNTIGVGILRLPGTVAAALGDGHLIVLVWVLGGVYAILGALSVAELAAMMPAAGGFYVYARRVFGPTVGFVVGWNDWLLNSITVAYAAVTGAEFITALSPSVLLAVRPVAHWLARWVPGLSVRGAAIELELLALLIVAAFTLLHWMGVRMGSGIQNAISALVGLMLVILAIGCFFVPTPVVPLSAGVGATAGTVASIGVVGLVAMIIPALRSVVVTYDGWYGAIYMAEETVDATRTIPRAMMGCAVLVMVLYVIINIGFLHALSLPVLAASTLPAADVARRLFAGGADVFVTAVSLGTVLGLINAVFLGAPRILYALARDGLLGRTATQVSDSGTPRGALGITACAVALFVISGTLNELIALAAVLFMLNYVSAYVSLVCLRRRQPEIARPFRAVGYPWSTGLVLIGSVAFLIAAVAEDPRSGLAAATLLLLALPVYHGLKARGLATNE